MSDIRATHAGGDGFDQISRKGGGHPLLNVDLQHIALELHRTLLGLLLERRDLHLHVGDDLFLLGETQPLRLGGAGIGLLGNLLALGVELAGEVEFEALFLLLERATFLAQLEFLGTGGIELNFLLIGAGLEVGELDAEQVARFAAGGLLELLSFRLELAARLRADGLFAFLDLGNLRGQGLFAAASAF